MNKILTPNGPVDTQSLSLGSTIVTDHGIDKITKIVVGEGLCSKANFFRRK